MLTTGYGFVCNKSLLITQLTFSFLFIENTFNQIFNLLA